MTFRKKDPELVSLFILGDDGNVKTRKYRVTKYQDFINTLQVNSHFFILKISIDGLANRNTWNALNKVSIATLSVCLVFSQFFFSFLVCF